MKQQILVVDDDRATREMLGLILKGAGYEVSFAEDGRTAVSKAHDERPDLVVIDGLLPGLHGFLACKAIKEQESPPKVILHTGVYTKPNYKWEAKREHGADDLLVKPAKPDELLACIKKHLSDSYTLPAVKATGECEVERR
ncbi:MAG TPA: response regulator [Blastocatellia bacterium]|nr:response regulator [Blastocatellia bacterium]